MAYRVFERVGRDGYSVFKDKAILSLSYVPEVLVGRAREEEYFARILTFGVRDGFLPPMIRVFGRPGSGKTVVVRSLLERFQQYQGNIFRSFYVNLRGCRTIFSAANSVLSSLCGRKLSVNVGLDRVFLEIWDEIKGLKTEGEFFLCIILDEVDSIFFDKHYDPSNFFYRFLRYQMFIEDDDIRLCLVIIANTPLLFDESVDGRVKSSMGREVVMFTAYSKESLEEILRARVPGAFKDDMVDEGVVVFCADVISRRSGDAREAIDLLRVSGEVANELKSSVSVRCARDAVVRLERDWVEELLRDLPFHSAIVLGVIAHVVSRLDIITTRKLYGFYTRLGVEGDEFKILGERRFLEIIGELDTLGLISSWHVSRGRKGYSKEIKLNMDSMSVLEYFRDDKKFSFQLLDL